MKLFVDLVVFVTVLALVLSAVGAQVCPFLPHCDACTNSGPVCRTCPPRTVLSTSRLACLDCGPGCETCTALGDESDTVKCGVCAMGYYNDNGVCLECGAGCMACHFDDVISSLACDRCDETGGYTLDKYQSPTSCVECPNNCAQCTKYYSGDVLCKKCTFNRGLNVRGYYLKSSDFSCRICPAYCEDCHEYNNVGVCDKCYDNYVLYDDNSDPTNQGRKCLRCPTNCATCSGIPLQDGKTVARCTACKPGLGLFLTAGTCERCTPDCKTCAVSLHAACMECLEGFRLDGADCVQCPNFCLSCTIDESTDVVSCGQCAEEYGAKPADSVTCDACSMSNCLDCRMNTDGTFTCSACKPGFYLKDNWCIRCPQQCGTCHWDTFDNLVVCDTCANSSYTASAQPECQTCSSSSGGDFCAACDWNGGANKCTACKSGYYLLTVSATCTQMVNNCAVGDSSQMGKCTTCKDDFGKLGGDSCLACPLNCKSCDNDAGKCDVDGCYETYIRSSSGMCIACIDHCINCAEETPWACDVCMDGYILNIGGTRCLPCRANCALDGCVLGDGGNFAVCTKCQAYDTNGLGQMGFALDSGGLCKACPDHCTSDCTWDSVSARTACSSSCATGFTLDPSGSCEVCPPYCETCEYLDNRIACSQYGCTSGYGRRADNLCDACPSGCQTCALPDEENPADILVCSACEGGYAMNHDVCANCPRQCKRCEYESGTMVCKECQPQFALNNNNVCVKCPTNCLHCSAYGFSVTCLRCEETFSLSLDRETCIPCSEAAFDRCQTCTDMGPYGLANCTRCEDGYVLEDNRGFNSSCVGTDHLFCGQGTYWDNGPECDLCSVGFRERDGRCAKLCYSCGDIATSRYVESSKCKATNESVIPCYSGICICRKDFDGNVACGCHPEDGGASICVGTRREGEICSEDLDGQQQCERCCTREKCNHYGQSMGVVIEGVKSTAGERFGACLFLLALSFIDCTGVFV